MLDYVEERIYGINVYRFTSTHGIPYQLTIQEDIMHQRYNVSLMDLTCKEKHISDSEVRIVISHILYKFIKNNRHYKLFFDLSMDKQEDFNRFFKFHRWSKAYNDISFKANLTKVKGYVYVEVYISLI